MKKRLVRIAAFISAVLILVCSFVVPVSATDVSDGSYDTIKVPYWNIDFLEVYYTTGECVLFDFPSTVWNNTTSTSSFFLLQNGSHTFSIDLRYIESQGYFQFLMSTDLVTNIIFHFRDSYIPYYLLDSTNDGVVYISTSYFDVNGNWTTGDGSITSASSRVEFLYPESVNDSDGYRIGKKPTLRTFTLTGDSTGNSLVRSVTPSYENMTNHSKFGLYSSYDDIVLSYPYVRSAVVLDGVDWLCLSLPLADFSFANNGDPYTNYDFITKYFGEYINVDYGGLTGFGGFMSNVVGGFIAAEIFPGLTIGALLFGVIGILGIIAFLRWFAGG